MHEREILVLLATTSDASEFEGLEVVAMIGEMPWWKFAATPPINGITWRASILILPLCLRETNVRILVTLEPAVWTAMVTATALTDLSIGRTWPF